MQYIRGLEAYHDTRPSAITLGKFDGLHLGHELLITRVEQHQKEENVVGIVFAFDMGKNGQKTLLSNEEKAEKLKGRVDYFVDCPFSEQISHMEAEAFIENVLIKRFHIRYIVVGTDFTFGYHKRGDYRMLQKYSEQYGYKVEVIEKKCYHGREISSTYIKEELQKGNHQLVDKLLGYHYEMPDKKSFDNTNKM